MPGRHRKRPREERRGQLALISRLPAWALELWRQFRWLSAADLRLCIEALRGLARLLEDVLVERLAAPPDGAQAEAGSSRGSRSGG